MFLSRGSYFLICVLFSQVGVIRLLTLLEILATINHLFDLRLSFAFFVFLLLLLLSLVLALTLPVVLLEL